MGRKLFVEVMSAHNLMPKNGQGSANAYCVVEYDDQRRITKVKAKDLNPVWNEKLDFQVRDPANMAGETLKVEIFNEKTNAKKASFLGRVHVNGSSFRKQGDEAVVSHQLEKRGLFSHIKGELRLKVWYVDEGKKEEGGKKDQNGKKEEGKSKEETKKEEKKDDKKDDKKDEGGKKDEKKSTATVSSSATAISPSLPMIVPAADFALKETAPVIGVGGKAISYDLVEKMQYLFVRVVKARRSSPSPAAAATENLNSEAWVKIKFGEAQLAKKKGIKKEKFIEWEEVFAFGKDKIQGPTLEVCIAEEEKAGSKEIGSVMFELSEISIRVPDSPLAPQWYSLEDKKTKARKEDGGGEVMLAVWWGTQADDTFSVAWQSDTGGFSHTKAKVYLSPKLWYLRLNVIEAQDLMVTDKTRFPEVSVRAQLGFQVRKTKVTSSRSSSPFWNQDLLFVAAEPFEEQLLVCVEDRMSGGKEEVLGVVKIGLNSIERRLDGRDGAAVTSRWYNLEKNGGSGFKGRIHLRLSFDGGYHVMDESTNHISDGRATAKQLWKKSLGVLEVGVLCGKSFLPMKTREGRGSTDAYCVAKYGPKWVRTRTVVDSLNPKWNEQYTWEVYDPCTVITVGVFDNCQIIQPSNQSQRDGRIGKVRIRLSTLESDRVYTNSYPLLVLQPSGVKKMGEIELAVRFSTAAMINLLQVYFQPQLPKIHYVHPLQVTEQETLRIEAIRMVAGRLTRAEPPLRQEVVQYMLDTDSNVFSMRRSKANYMRMVNILSGTIAVTNWLSEICKWTNPVTTVLVHILYCILAWFPELILPTMFLYMFLIGCWKYRYRPKSPPSMDAELSQADGVVPDELDEEFDSFPTSKTQDVVKARYDRLRLVASRIQSVVGDIAAQGERVSALLSWRDPRATGIFITFCLVAAIVLYVTPFRVIAILMGVYVLRHPRFRDKVPPVPLNFFRRLPSLADRIL